MIPSELRNQNLFSQITYNQVFSSEECQKLIQEFEEKTLESASLASGKIDNNIRQAKSRFFEPDSSNRWFHERITALGIEANQKYFHFRINGISDMQFIRYDPGNFYDWHLDVGSSETMCTRKLTIITFLSERESYTGGHLLWNFDKRDEKDLHKMSAGAVVIFPSFIPHRVNPVISGVRYVISAWAHGPSFC